LVAVATALAVLAVALWSVPGFVAGFAAFDAGALGARFAGCWFALLATAAGWAAWHGGVAATRLPALALVFLPAGMLLGAARTADQLRPAAALVHVAVLVTVLLAGAVVASSAARKPGTADRPATATMGK
ncbi:MAG: hypothetical protein L0H84_16130, partial [Pseudonocardia sp.]|nr:hypothetical protein [Pseudonocardia sp.]